VALAPDVVVAIAGMGVCSYACRALGFWIMGFVPLTPRVRAWLETVPISVMIAMLVGAAARGGVAEWCGLAVALAVMRATGQELVGMAAGVAAVALARSVLA
jgi:uncharacterized membrane protein